AGAALEHRRESLDLRGAEPAGRQERRGRYRAREPDQGERTAPAHEWKRCGVIRAFTFIRAHIVAPVPTRVECGPTHIDVVISGHQGDVAGGPKRCEP